MRKLGLLFLGILCLVGVGCTGAETTVSAEQEKNFRNPPKEIPPDIAARMAKAREEAQKGAGGQQTPAPGN